MLLAILHLLATSFWSQPAPAPLPSWAEARWNTANLGQTFSRANYAKPNYLEADFNGDGKRDIAILVTRKSPRS